MSHMGTKAKQPTIGSKALSVAIKREMVTKGLKTPALARESGVPYGTLRKILELNTVADFEQLTKIADALHVMLSDLVKDSEDLAADPEFVADYERETGGDAGNASAAGDVAGSVGASVVLPVSGKSVVSDEDVADTIRKLASGLGVAAYRGDHKFDGDGDDPA